MKNANVTTFFSFLLSLSIVVATLGLIPQAGAQFLQLPTPHTTEERDRIVESLKNTNNLKDVIDQAIQENQRNPTILTRDDLLFIFNEAVKNSGADDALLTDISKAVISTLQSAAEAFAAGNKDAVGPTFLDSLTLIMSILNSPQCGSKSLYQISNYIYQSIHFKTVLSQEHADKLIQMLNLALAHMDILDPGSILFLGSVLANDLKLDQKLVLAIFEKMSKAKHVNGEVLGMVATVESRYTSTPLITFENILSLPQADANTVIGIAKVLVLAPKPISDASLIVHGLLNFRINNSDPNAGLALKTLALVLGSSTQIFSDGQVLVNGILDKFEGWQASLPLPNNYSLVLSALAQATADAGQPISGTFDILNRIVNSKYLSPYDLSFLTKTLTSLARSSRLTAAQSTLLNTALSQRERVFQSQGSFGH